MTTEQTIVVAVLWVAVAGLFALVLLLYRAVERAYRQSTHGEQGGLSPGAQAPPIEVLTGDGITVMEPPAGDAPYLLGFVKPDCEDCSRLLDTLLDTRAYDGRSTLVIVGGRGFDRPVARDAPVTVLPAAHPPDLQRGYGLSTLPLVYMMKGQTVLAVGSPTTPAEVRELVEASRPLDDGSPLSVALAGGTRSSNGG